MTSTPLTSKANGTEYHSEGQTSSADQEQVSTQKYIKVTKEQPGDRRARTQVVLNKLREFVCKTEGEKVLEQELKEAVHSEVAFTKCFYVQIEHRSLRTITNSFI